jgi:chromosome segregation ATPase
VDRMRRDAGASRDDRGRVEEDLKVAREEAAALKSQLASAEQSLAELLGLQKESATASMELISLKTRLAVVGEELLHVHDVATTGEKDLVAIRNDWHMSLKEAHALRTQFFTAMVQTDQVTKATGYEELTESQENMLEDEALDLVRQSFDELIQAKKALEDLRERMRTRLSMLQSAAERVVADRVKLTNAMREMQEELVEQHDLRMEAQWLRGENDRVHRRLARLLDSLHQQTPGRREERGYVDDPHPWSLSGSHWSNGHSAGDKFSTSSSCGEASNRAEMGVGVVKQGNVLVAASPTAMYASSTGGQESNGSKEETGRSTDAPPLFDDQYFMEILME